MRRSDSCAYRGSGRLGNAALTVITSSVSETIDLAGRLAANLLPSDVVALKGPLGAGKTVLAKAIGQALGVTDVITSPTYTIVAEYEGSLPFFHVDLYRIASEAEYELLGLDEIFDEGGITVVEWPERAGTSLPVRAQIIEIEIVGDTSRRLTLSDTRLEKRA